jgi:hypothetical protein
LLAEFERAGEHNNAFPIITHPCDMKSIEKLHNLSVLNPNKVKMAEKE